MSFRQTIETRSDSSWRTESIFGPTEKEKRKMIKEATNANRKSCKKRENGRPEFSRLIKCIIQKYLISKYLSKLTTNYLQVATNRRMREFADDILVNRWILRITFNNTLIQ